MTTAQAAPVPETGAHQQELEPGDIVVLLDEVLKDRGMSLGELSRRTGITTKNLAELKNGKKKAIWWSTLAPVCAVLDCQPGDLLRHVPTHHEPAD
jgi:putative transcriptional regulator